MMYTGTKILEVDNRQDTIDSRDIIARIEELESDREPLQDALDEAQTERNASDVGTEEYEAAQQALTDAQQALDDWDGDMDGEELKVLKALAEECEGYSEWEDGATLIRDSYFKDYAQELAEAIGAIPDNLQWPCTCIDWEQAADELKMDYTRADYDGVDYWVRSC